MKLFSTLLLSLTLVLVVFLILLQLIFIVKSVDEEKPRFLVYSEYQKPEGVK